MTPAKNPRPLPKSHIDADGTPWVATFSIAAVDPASGEVGVAVASKFLAVGNIVPWMAAGIGSVATQALANATFGPKGLALMGQGVPASEALARLLADDPGRERRQVGFVDASGNSASHTGSGCQPWAGHRNGPGFACQGNILTGPETLDAMVEAFQTTSGPLHDRLFAALSAGDRAGGDRRGRQSAAIKVLRAGGGYQGLSDVVMDLRVDDAPDPIAELERLMELYRLYLPSGAPAEKLALQGVVLDELREMATEAGLFAGDNHTWHPALRNAIDAFTGAANLEDRIDLEARTIDKVALDYLRGERSKA
ncbi:MAG: major pilin protein FimA [Hyphomicrobiales bacterium]|nr:major pilin protein FimA [Hyphomicrobiales bacterium]